MSENIRRHRQTVGFAGFGAEVETTSPELLEILRSCYAGFTEAQPLMRITADVSHHSNREHPQMARDCDDLDVTITDDLIVLESEDFGASFDVGMRAIYIRQPFAIHPIDACIRTAYTATHREHGGFLVHGSGIILDGKAYVFYGDSGCGKSTIAGLLGGCFLGDELVAIRRTRHGFQACGTPFWLGKNACAPLAAIYSLRQSELAYTRQLPSGEAVRKLIGSFQTMGASEEIMNDLLDFCCELVWSVPTGELCFNLDVNAVAATLASPVYTNV